MFSNLFSRLKNFAISYPIRLFLLMSLGIATVAGISFVSLTQYRFFSTRLTERPEEIKGNIVTLRKLKEEYFIDYHNMWSQTVRRGIEFPEDISLDYTIRHLRYDMARDAKKEILKYLIFDNKDDKLIGALAIGEKNDRDPGQFSCWLNENYWGGGRIQEALALITKTYFALTDAKSFNAHVRLWNKRSYAALKKFGFKDIGFYYENGEKTRYLLEYYRP